MKLKRKMTMDRVIAIRVTSVEAGKDLPIQLAADLVVSVPVVAARWTVVRVTLERTRGLHMVETKKRLVDHVLTTTPTAEGDRALSVHEAPRTGPVRIMANPGRTTCLAAHSASARTPIAERTDAGDEMFQVVIEEARRHADRA